MVRRENEIEQCRDETEIPDFEVDSIARCLLPKIQAYFESAEGQAAFKAWKKRKSENT